MLRRSIQALLRASYINERTGGGRSRLRQCLLSLNPLEPALLHRWTSLKVKTFPHQGFVKENGCIFLEAIIFILLSVLESNPPKPSASGVTGLSVCLLLQSRDGAGGQCGAPIASLCCSLPSVLGGCTRHPDHQRSKNGVKARARSTAGQGGSLGHSRDFKVGTVAYCYPALSAQACLLVLVWVLPLPPRRNTHPFVIHGYVYIVTVIRFGTWWCCREKGRE